MKNLRRANLQRGTRPLTSDGPLAAIDQPFSHNLCPPCYAGSMIGRLHYVLAMLVSQFKSKSRLEAENAVLRHQLTVLRRKVKG